MLAVFGSQPPHRPQQGGPRPRGARPLVFLALVAALPALLSTGCAAAPARRTVMLAPAQKNPESVGLEIFVLRYAPDDPTLTHEVWSQIDEQQFPPATRRLLAANGLRAGLVGVQLPEQLVRAMDLPEQPPADSESTQLLDVAHQPRLARRLLQIRSGQQGRIITTGEFARHPELSLLVRNAEGEVVGRTYRQVMGLLSLEVYGLGDGRVRLELTPEIEYGEPQRTVVARHGVLQYDFGPPHRAFDELRMAAVLAPGQSLAIAAMPDLPGTLGQRLLSELVSGREEHKLVLIRLYQPQADPLLDGQADAAEPATPTASKNTEGAGA